MKPVLKRAIDLAGSAAGLLLTAPVMAVAAAAIRWNMGKPALFRQRRGGLHGRVFTLCKFRTMNHATDGAGNLLPDAARLTALGRFLRSSSIDELPQLWNVLRGDMSLVGPRPLMAEYLERYDTRQRRRHEVRPGITGWAQIRGRNATSWDQRFELDVWYVDHWSLSLDLKILAATVLKVLLRDGVSMSNHATMPEFQGSSRSIPIQE